MSEPRRERADAARNRRAILDATERLLAEHRPELISIEQVAAAAGVGKGTVFHRFGNRSGLMLALAQERVEALHGQVAAGPPPLGPGAPAGERLLAFLDAVVDVVTRNAGLMVALDHATVTSRHGDGHPHDHPIYVFWHSHVAALLAAERPDLDADAVAHVLLGCLRSESVTRVGDRNGGDRLAEALRAVAISLLPATMGYE